ncbi:MAG: YggS family pyridoxal phosphate-dependent enzyme [Nanoarchaeota archaeon]
MIKDLEGVKLVAVTKTFGISEIEKLKENGLNVFGENRVDDSEEKVKNINAEWHMIGHLQTNKVGKAVELFDVIQSVDSVHLAKIIGKECEKQGKIIPIFIQVNISEESQKYGFKKHELENALNEISKIKNILIEGFMMIAPFVEPEETRIYFKEMKKLFDKYKDKYNLKWLSMGMSNDYQVAIEEGANMVRIGRGLGEIL